MGAVSDDVDNHCRVYSGDGFKVQGAKSIVQKCLYAFPFIWVSVVRVFICGKCLIMLNVAQILGCECQSLLTLSYQLNKPFCVLLSSM